MKARILAVFLALAGIWVLAHDAGSHRVKAQFNGCQAGFCNPPAVAAGGAATTWDPGAHGTGISLDATHLIATYTGSSATNAAKANVSHSTGKFYFELTWNVNANNARESGIGNSSAGLTGYQLGVNDTNSIGWGGSGAVFCCSGTTLTNIQAYGTTPPVTLGIASDLGGALEWFFSANVSQWNNDILANQNPATGTGGIARSVTGAPFFPMASLFASGDAVTACFLPGCYVFTKPAGFGDW